MNGISLGINLWSQASDWGEFLAAGQAADRLGYDHLWTWDHLLPIFGELDQPIHEGYTALAALAMATERTRLGLFVGANTFRNPGPRREVAGHHRPHQRRARDARPRRRMVRG